MAAARLEALASMPPSGGESDVEPIDALLFCVRREAARGVWLRLRLELLDPDGSAISDPAAPAGELHRPEAQATERLARISKMATKRRGDRSLSERRVSCPRVSTARGRPALRCRSPRRPFRSDPLRAPQNHC